MTWYHYVSYFFAGAFLANAVPHVTNGISGRPFQSPFAYLLICRVGSFSLLNTAHVLTLGAGLLFVSIMLARSFGRFHGGL